MDALPHPHAHHEHLATRVAAGGGGANARRRRWWDRTPLWWIAVLFAIGSACFPIGALLLLPDASPRPGGPHRSSGAARGPTTIG